MQGRLYDTGRRPGTGKTGENKSRMTAVFVTNYEMTMGAVIGLNELGMRGTGGNLGDRF